MSQFITFGLAPHLLSALEKAGIINPTPVQAETIRPACEGRDILATAQTGTGKTFAYLLPLLTRIDADKNQMGLILVPTRELAIQVKAAINQLCSRTHAKVALLIGGEPIFKQLRVLKTNPSIVVGTPGRVMDHLDRRTLLLDGCSFFVLDEVDRMLDMGFSQQLNFIRKSLPQTIQTLMFSATMPKSIAGLAEQYLSNPHRITLGSVHQPVVNIKQDIVHTQDHEKFDCLIKELDAREGSVIVFVKTKKGAEILAKKLKHKLYEAEAIHGDLKQQKRVFIVDQFRKQLNRIMVATDIAARGIDVPHVQHVVNYDLPQSPEDYVHRIGRTGRAGNQGFAVSLISPSESRQWINIQRFLQGKSYSSHLKIEGFVDDNDFYSRGRRTPSRSRNNQSRGSFVRNRRPDDRFSTFGNENNEHARGERTFSDRPARRHDNRHDNQMRRQDGQRPDDRFRRQRSTATESQDYFDSPRNDFRKEKRYQQRARDKISTSL